MENLIYLLKKNLRLNKKHPMKIKIILVFLTVSSFAQTKGKFVFELKETSIINVGDSNNHFFDYDLDGDLDLIISGYNKHIAEDSNTHTFLYNNDGKGNFTKDERSSFMRIEYGKIDVADINNDTYLDVVITGQELNKKREDGIVIYKNEKGVFKKIQKIKPKSTNGYSSYAGFINVNKDKYIDLLIERDSNIEYYVNDKKGSFIFKGELKGAGDVYEYGVVPFDMDNDGDDEVLLQGEELVYGDTPTIKNNSLFFKNEEKGYTSVNHVFKETNQGVVKVVDIDNDGDQDVFMTNIGSIEKHFDKSVFYMNTSKGFKTVENEIMVYNLGTTCFSDLDNDGDKDLIILGGRKGIEKSDYYVEAIDIYENDKGAFKLFKANAFPYLDQNSINTADVDGDGDQDILLTGYEGENTKTRLYMNKLK